MYAKETITKYLDDLADRKPAPGGGSAAALEAALGCALMSMVANYTISNKRYAEFKDRAKDSLDKSEKLRGRLLRLVDEDVQVYGRLSEGFKKFGKGSPELDRMYKEACNVPYDICKITNQALTLCGELVEYANKNLITDTAIAALMLESAFFGAKFNVYINLSSINDDGYVEEAHKTILSFEKAVSKLKEEILQKCQLNF